MFWKPRRTDCPAGAALVLAIAVVIATASTPVLADEIPKDAAEAVQQALFARGMKLYAERNYRDALTLFEEAIARRPGGPRADDAIAMASGCREKLGITRPAPAGPRDPYFEGKATGKGVAADESGLRVPAAVNRTRTKATAWAGGYGLVSGLAFAGPLSGSGKLKAVSVLSGLALGVGYAAGAHHLWKRTSFGEGTTHALMSAGSWGAVQLTLLGDVFTGDNSDTNDLYKYAVAGGALGVGAGVLWSVMSAPTPDDIAVVNSLAMYGASEALLLAIVIAPPRSEAYSLNAFFGSAAGLAAGVWLLPKLKMSRSRSLWIDMGAVVGAAVPWVLVYPFIASDTSKSDTQVTSLLSMATLGGGVAAGWYFTRNMDGAAENGEKTVWPTVVPSGDGGAVAGIAGAF